MTCPDEIEQYNDRMSPKFLDDIQNPPKQAYGANIERLQK